MSKQMMWAPVQVLNDNGDRAVGGGEGTGGSTLHCGHVKILLQISRESKLGIGIRL